MSRAFEKITQSLPSNASVESNFLTNQTLFILDLAGKKERGACQKHFSIPARSILMIVLTLRWACGASSRIPQTIELLFDKEIRTFTLDRQWNGSQVVEERDERQRLYEVFYNSNAGSATLCADAGAVKARNPPELIEQIKAEAEAGFIHTSPLSCNKTIRY
ncbi:MAG: hypothetical protein LBK73_01200 [Treponema sp.]|nr:hypothetical protein [Treponema sp.]